MFTSAVGIHCCTRTPFGGGGLWGKSIFLGALSSTPAESAERASSTPHEKVRACRESEGRGPELVGLVQTQSTCVSKQKCVFAQQDMTLAADGVFLFIALAKYCLVCVCVCACACCGCFLRT